MTEKYFVAAGYGDTGQSSNLIVLKITDNGKIQIKQEFYYDGGPSYLVEKVISDHRSCIYAAFEKTNEIVKFVWENGILTEEKRFQAPGEGLIGRLYYALWKLLYEWRLFCCGYRVVTMYLD